MAISNMGTPSAARDSTLRKVTKLLNFTKDPDPENADFDAYDHWIVPYEGDEKLFKIIEKAKNTDLLLYIKKSGVIHLAFTRPDGTHGYWKLSERSPAPYLHFNHKYDQCTICLEDLDLSTDKESPNFVISPECDHLIHTDCLEKWSESKDSETVPCPSCRGEINVNDFITSSSDRLREFLSQKDHQGEEISGLKVEYEDLGGFNFQHCKLAYTSLARSNLSNIDLRNATLSVAGDPLSGVDLRDTYCKNARLKGTKIHGAKLWGAIKLKLDSDQLLELNLESDFTSQPLKTIYLSLKTYFNHHRNGSSQKKHIFIYTLGLKLLEIQETPERFPTLLDEILEFLDKNRGAYNSSMLGIFSPAHKKLSTYVNAFESDLLNYHPHSTTAIQSVTTR